MTAEGNNRHNNRHGRRRKLSSISSSSPTFAPIVTPPLSFDYSVHSAIQLTEDGGRLGHVSSIWPLTTSPAQTTALPNLAQQYAVAYMALEHFNHRSGAVIPELPEILQGCDLQLTMDVRNDQLSNFRAVEGLMDAVSVNNTTQQQQPFAILGSLTSGVSYPLSILTDALQIIQISGSATSAALDKREHFTRTAATNQGESAAFMVYLQSIQVDRIGILYLQDEFGESFQEELLAEAHLHQIDVAISMPYEDSSIASMESSIRLLKASDVRYIITVVNAYNWKPVVRMAHHYDIMGPDSGRQWYMAEYKDILDDDFALDPTTEGDIAEALHGMGILYLHISKREAFEQALSDFYLGKQDKDAINNTTTTKRDRFIASHVQPELYDNFDFVPPETNIFTYLDYDSMMALGIAACRTPGQFTTQEFLPQLLQSEFPGVSGWVALDKTTGTRLAKDLEYRVANILLDSGRSSNTTLRFTSDSAVSIQHDNLTHIGAHNYIYADNTTMAPPVLPPISHHDYNLLPTYALVIGWVLMGSVMLLSLACLVWTICNRNNPVVRISQPLFLCQLCVGTFLMSLAVIPLSLQDVNQDGIPTGWNLDAACMATPWLLCIGFVTAMSAILAKTLRLNKVVSNSREMKRIVVKPTDVLLPLVILMALSVTLLLVCTIVAPYTFQRILDDDNVDMFGRSLESFGTCQHIRPAVDTTDMTTYYIMIPVVIVNFIGLCFAVHQCYLARNLPTEMSESWYLFVTTLSLLEVGIIGGPILLFPDATPEMYFLVLNSIVSLACFGILLPIFVPKYQQRHDKRVTQLQRSTLTRGNMLKSGTRSHNKISGLANTSLAAISTHSSKSGGMMSHGSIESILSGVGAATIPPRKSEWGKMSVVRLQHK